MRYRESKAIEEAKLALVNFRKKDPFPLGYDLKIYDQLERKFGVDVAKSILVRWLPEGDGFCSMTLIDQNGNICDFEINSNDQNDSSVEPLPVSEFVKSNRYKQLKPWDDLKVSIDFYQSSQQME